MGNTWTKIHGLVGWGKIRFTAKLAVFFLTYVLPRLAGSWVKSQLLAGTGLVDQFFHGFAQVMGCHKYGLGHVLLYTLMRLAPLPQIIFW